MMKKTVILILTILSLSGCFSNAEKPKTVTIENRYSVTMPSYLIESSDLHDDAPLQYWSKWRALCIIVLDESKNNWSEALEEYDVPEEYTDDLKGYSTALLNDFTGNVSATRLSEPVDTLINDMPAVLVSFVGKVDNLDLFYSVAFVEGEEQYYQMILWTTADKEEKHKEVMNQMIYSFEEL